MRLNRGAFVAVCLVVFLCCGCWFIAQASGVM